MPPPNMVCTWFTYYLTQISDICLHKLPWLSIICHTVTGLPQVAITYQYLPLCSNVLTWFAINLWTNRRHRTPSTCSQFGWHICDHGEDACPMLPATHIAFLCSCCMSNAACRTLCCCMLTPFWNFTQCVARRSRCPPW